MDRGRGAVAAVAVVAASTTAWAGPAVAAQPEWAGPPVVQSFDLVDDPISFQCGDRHLVFTAGELVVRTRVLPDGSFRDTRRPVGGTLVDQFGNVYRVHGTAAFAGDPDGSDGQFRLTGAAVGPRGMTETLNSRFTFEGGAVTPDERGTCTVVFS